ncbi:MAG: LOG family protein [Acidimicrobiales bacterium]
MSAPRPNSTFGDGNVDRLISEVLGLVGEDGNDDLVRKLVVTALEMDEADVGRLELKIASQALAEMLNAYKVFSQHRERAKVTVFGSARTAPDHPDFVIARDFSRIMAERDWMTISGAGPGIMTAAIEGAGVENSFGVSIVLPFEAKAADIIDGDPKLAIFRYFFTRKLFFMKETDAFALFPGGFGTLDETFELLTLIQTGKAYPAPIVLLDHPESGYWNAWQRFVDEGLAANGMIKADDTDLYLHTHDPEEAADYLCAFYATFHSIRYVGKRLLVRMNRALDGDAIETLNDEFGDIVVSGRIEPTEATAAERRDDDHVDLARLGFRFDDRSFARLTQMIHRMNELGGPQSPAAHRGLVHDLDPEPDD